MRLLDLIYRGLFTNDLKLLRLAYDVGQRRLPGDPGRANLLVEDKHDWKGSSKGAITSPCPPILSQHCLWVALKH